MDKSNIEELNLSSVLCKAASELGYPTLKVEQEQAITYFISGNAVLVSLLTGYGKSLCFAILPKVFDLLRDEHKAIVLVISPLLSIISNQVISFKRMGISAAFAGDDDRAVRKKIKLGEYQLLFISSESLFCTLEWRRVLYSDVYRANPVAVVIDEAHCIKKTVK